MVGPEFSYILTEEKTYVKLQECKNKCEFVVQCFIIYCYAMF